MSTRGYVIMAVNNAHTDYVACASTLCDSIHRVMPDALVTLITDQVITDTRYDKIITITDTDTSEWKLANDWMIYDLSPYEHTVKLEADMYLPRSIEHWWDILADRELNICTTIRNFRGKISTEKYYRKTFVDSGIPDTYNAITYFKRGEIAKQFFECVRDIFENWTEYKQQLKHSSEERATTDVVYAIAAQMIGIENCTLPNFTDFSMTHMKQYVNGLTTSVWHDELVYEVLPHTFRINTYTQMYPIHYHSKGFAKIIDEEIKNG